MKDGRVATFGGVDDPLYQETNAVVQDPKFFSCVANMVLLPTPLKAFTDTVPEVKAMLRICARNMYGWQCDHLSQASANAKLDAWNDWDIYPRSWPKQEGESEPLGVIKINDDIRAAVNRRWQSIQKDLNSAGPYYPKDDVRSVLAYWGLDPSKPLKDAHDR